MASALYNNSPIGNPQYTGPPLNDDPNYNANMTNYLNNLHSLTGYKQGIESKKKDYINTGNSQSVGALPLVIPGSNPEPHSYPDIDLVSKEQEIQKMRSELDEKLRELYGTDNSILSDSKMELDTSVYTGVLWTILATATVYYLFVYE
jgi:hypothetical protein